MYGITTTGASGLGAGIAYTGVNVGVGVMTAFGLIMLGSGLLALVRPAPKNKP